MITIWKRSVILIFVSFILVLGSSLLNSCIPYKNSQSNGSTSVTNIQGTNSHLTTSSSIDGFDTELPVGIIVSEIPIVDPNSGAKGNNNVASSQSAIIYLFEQASFIHSISFSPAELLDGTNKIRSGISSPIFKIDILAVNSTHDVSGTIFKSFNDQSLKIGKQNIYSVEGPIEKGKYVAVLISTITKSSVVQQKIQQKANYYLTIPAKSKGANPVAVSNLSSPLFENDWTFATFFDADIVFDYETSK